MIIGIPKEIKEHEYRVGITPSGVRQLKEDGHHVMVEHSAGIGSGFSDDEYRDAGAELTDKERIYKNAELIVKVKEPLLIEYGLLNKGQAIFTYLHLAPNPELIDILLKKEITALAYETLEEDGELPLLKPMSEIAGRMAPIIGAYYLQRFHGGEGVLISGAEGVSPAKVVIIGAGNVGMNALSIAVGMGADVTILNRTEDKLRQIDEIYRDKVKTVVSSKEAIEEGVLGADVVIGAVLVTGSRTPILITREIVSRMKKGSVIVDVSVDQGGCVETTRPTTHSNPVYVVDGVIHYAVSNMPGAYPRTSTIALTSKTIKYIRILANIGIEKAINENRPLISALNTYRGKIMHKGLTGV